MQPRRVLLAENSETVQSRRVLFAEIQASRLTRIFLPFQGLAKVPRFSIAVKLMSKGERALLESIIDRMSSFEGFAEVDAKYRTFLQK